jgi:hypothetical protein
VVSGEKLVNSLRSLATKRIKRLAEQSEVPFIAFALISELKLDIKVQQILKSVSVYLRSH